MEKEGMNNILTNFFIAGLGFLFLYYSRTTISIATAYALGTGLGLLSIAIALKDDVKKIFSHFNRKIVGHIITSAWPFGLVGLMGTIMLNTDIFIIGWLMSLKDVALYSAPQKIIQLLYIGPVLISTAFFPAFARHVKDATKFKDFFETGISLILMFAIPMALGAFMLSGPIIDLIYGPGFEASVLSFKILSFTIVIFSFLVLIGNAIFAHDKPRVYITYAILGVAGNLVFDFLFIPIWGIAGSAIATLLNQLMISAYAWREMKKISKFSVLAKTGKIFLASIFMGVSVFALDMLQAGVILNILASATLYFAILFALREEAFLELLGKTSSKV